jgi:hypothetical protein
MVKCTRFWKGKKWQFAMKQQKQQGDDVGGRKELCLF